MYLLAIALLKNELKHYPAPLPQNNVIGSCLCDTNELNYCISLTLRMAENLTRIRRYEGGCMSISYLYNVGQNAASDWVGVTTVGIWT